MNSRFQWILIFVTLNIVIILSLGTYYQWVPVTQWSSFSYYSVLMAMLLLAAAIFVAFILPDEKREDDILPWKDRELHSQALHRAEQQLLEDTGTEEQQYPGDPDLKQDLTLRGNDQGMLTGNGEYGAEGYNTISRHLEEISTAGDVSGQAGSSESLSMDTKVPASLARERVLDSTEILVSDYRNTQAPGLPLHTYVAGAYMPGKLMDHDPGDVGTIFILTREASNIDPYAIRVREQSGNRIGFIPRPLNRVMAPLMDQGQSLEAILIHKKQVCQSLRLELEIRSSNPSNSG